MSQELKVAIFAGVLPGVIAGVGLLLAWWKTRKPVATDETTDASEPEPGCGAGSRMGGRWVAPLTLMLGYPLANYSIHGVPKLWPDSNPERFVHVAMLLGLLGVFEAVVPRRGLFKGFARIVTLSVLRAATLAGAVWMLGEGYYSVGTFTAREFYGLMAAAAIGGAAVIGIADRAASIASARVITPALLLIGAASIPVLFFAGSANLSQVGAILVAWPSAALVVGVLVPSLRLDRGGITVFVGLVIAHSIGTKFQTYAPELHGELGLIFLAAAAAGLTLLWIRKGDTTTTSPTPSKRRVLLSWVAVLGMLIAAGGIVAMAQPTPDPNDPYADY